MKYLFILNPISGEKNKINKVVDKINNLIINSGHTFEIVFTTGPGNATELARKGVNDGVDVIVAAGGDGTINETAVGLVNSNCSLGVIPLGSGNGFARSLKIPLQLDQSIEFLLNPTISKIDVGKANDRYFFGVCGIGYDANVGKKFQDFGIRGPIPYFLIGIKELISYRPDKLVLSFNDQNIETSALLVAFANTRQYGNGAIIAPKADPRDGLLDLCVINNISLGKAFYAAFKLFKGTINQSIHYTHFRCKSVKIQSDSNYGFIHMDGEPFLKEKYISIDLIESALNVCAPIDK